MREPIRAALATRIEAQWDKVNVCPLVWDNQPGAADGERVAKAWARASILYASGEAAAIGTAFLRETGILTLQVFIPKGGGFAVSTKAADELARVLQFAALTFTAGAKVGTIDVDRINGPTPAGNRDDYSQYMVQAEFRADWGR